MSNYQFFIKDPSAVLDYAFDWSAWLAGGEIITSKTVTVQTGLTKVSDSETNGIVTVWLSGGEERQTYTVACKITTSAGRTDERTINICIEQR